MSYTCAQLISLACQQAFAPGFIAQAGQELNLILEELAQSYSWVSAQGWWAGTFGSGIGGTVRSASVVAGSGPYQLPSDFQRAKFGDFFWTNGGINYFPTPLDINEYDELVQQPGFSSYVNAFAIDMSTTPPGLYVWPAPSGAYPFYMRYDSLPADVTSPETSAAVPWFPFEPYLLRRLAGQMMGYTGDTRQAQWLGDDAGTIVGSASWLLKKYMAKEGNTDNRAVTVKLDPRHFGPRWNNLPPTKQVPW